MYLTRKLKLGRTKQLDRLAGRSGMLWSQVAKWHWRFVRRQGHWPSKKAMQRWLCKGYESLHSQSSQAVADSFYGALSGWREKRKSGNYEGLRPPYKQKRYFKVQWKSSAIRLRDDSVLRLSNGRGEDPLLEDPLLIDWPSATEPKRVEIGWDGQQYELRCQYKVEPAAEPKGNETAGVDLGEIHLAAVYTDSGSFLFNGRELRSLRRQQNRTKARFAKKIARKTRGSRRWKRLVRAKNRKLETVRSQILDLLHKQSTRLVNTLHERRVRTVVVGDVTGIRERIDYGKKANQKLHQWCYSKFASMLEYKARLHGMTVERVGEAYTSQECPSCQNRKKPSGREYRCSECGFKGHRDVVGAANIRQKYQGEIPVAGVMASPTGVRYHPHMRCNPPSSHQTPSGAATMKREKAAKAA